jgi:hypothetical protein
MLNRFSAIFCRIPFPQSIGGLAKRCMLPFFRFFWSPARKWSGRHELISCAGLLGICLAWESHDRRADLTVKLVVIPSTQSQHNAAAMPR